MFRATIRRSGPGLGDGALSGAFVLAWSSGFLGARLGTGVVGTLGLLGWRFALIAPVLVALALLEHGAHARRDRSPGHPAGSGGPPAARPAGLPASRSGRARPDSARPDSTRPDSTRPDSTRPDSTRPDSTRLRWLTGRDVAVHGAAGLLGQVAYLGGVVGAVQLGVNAGIAALVAALQPMLAGALSGPVLGERVTRRQWAGLSLGIVGVALVVGTEIGGGAAPGWAYALPVAGMAGLVAASLLERRATAGPTRPGGARGGAEATPTPLMTALAVQGVTAALVFVPLALLTGQLGVPGSGQLRFWAAVACTTVPAGLGGYGLYWVVLRRRGVTRVSALLYLTPPVTGLLAWLLFGDPVTVTALAGLAVCAAAVLLSRATPTPERSDRDGGPATEIAAVAPRAATAYRHAGGPARPAGAGG